MVAIWQPFRQRQWGPQVHVGDICGPASHNDRGGLLTGIGNINGPDKEPICVRSSLREQLILVAPHLHGGILNGTCGIEFACPHPNVSRSTLGNKSKVRNAEHGAIGVAVAVPT